MSFKDIYKNISEDLVSDDIYFDEEEKLALRLREAESQEVVINNELTFRFVKSDVGYLVDVFGKDKENPIESLTFWEEDLEAMPDDDLIAKNFDEPDEGLL